MTAASRSSMPSAPGRWKIPAPLVAGAALLIVALALGSLEAAQSYLRAVMQGRPFSWRLAWIDALPAWVLLAALSPLPIALAQIFRLDRGRRGLAIAIHLGGAAAFALLHQSAAALVLAWRFQDSRITLLMSKMFSLYFATDFVIYWSIVGAWYALDYRRQLRDREVAASQLVASLSQARLEALRAQLNPHFLFNTLNAISVLALKGEGETVARTLSQLSELLRLSLDGALPQEVPLEDELEFTARYLAIQEVRFPDRLTVIREVEPEALNAMVPSLVLQPLVENAVVHGVARQTGPGRIEIRAVKCGDRLRLEVRDSGPGFPAGPWREGIGLANTRARLEQLYSADFRFETGSNGGGHVTLDLPYRPRVVETGRSQWSA